MYGACAEKLGLQPDEVALVAAHPWDIQGAKQRGLMTGYVTRGGAPFPSVMKAPDVQAQVYD